MIYNKHVKHIIFAIDVSDPTSGACAPSYSLLDRPCSCQIGHGSVQLTPQVIISVHCIYTSSHSIPQ
ncbi:hypothetical protein ACET3X_007126 [Alternaria dauci]|uniref:Uncharacterized protein n=1 Tax=Alternaria dauci TaxID=48095 RepID=A0ABR3UG43_9PLEO